MAEGVLFQKEVIVSDLQRILDLADLETVEISVYITPSSFNKDSDEFRSLVDCLEEQEIESWIKRRFRAGKTSWEISNRRFLCSLTGNQIEDLGERD